MRPARPLRVLRHVELLVARLARRVPGALPLRPRRGVGLGRGAVGLVAGRGVVVVVGGGDEEVLLDGLARGGRLVAEGEEDGLETLEVGVLDCVVEGWGGHGCSGRRETID